MTSTPGNEAASDGCAVVLGSTGGGGGGAEAKVEAEGREWEGRDGVGREGRRNGCMFVLVCVGCM